MPPSIYSESTMNKPSSYIFITKYSSSPQEARLLGEMSASMQEVVKCQKTRKCSETNGDISKQTNTSYVCDNLEHRK